MNFDYSFNTIPNQTKVWAFVSDIEAVLKCLPICKSVAKRPDGSYDLVLEDRVGPFKVSFQVVAKVECHEAEQWIHANGQGRDKIMGNTVEVQIDVKVISVDQGPEVSVQIQSQVSVRGPVAQLGFAIMQRKAEDVFRVFSERVQAALATEEG